METVKLQMATELAPIATRLKEIFLIELTNALDKETKSYLDFISDYKQAFEKYRAAFQRFKKEKHIASFLYGNIQLNTELKIALENFCNDKEPIYLPGALASISKQAFDLFANLSEIKKSTLYRLIENELEQQELNKSKWDNKKDQLFALVKKKKELDPEDDVNSIVYYFFQQTITAILKEQESSLFSYYYRLAELSQELWDSYKINTSFIQKLDEVKYELENFDIKEFDWELDILVIQKISPIENEFKQLINEISGTLETSILNFEYTLPADQKVTVLSKAKILKNLSSYYSKVEKSKSLWRVTRMAMAEDFSFDLEFLTLKYLITQEYIGFVKSFNNNFNTPLYSGIDGFETQLEILIPGVEAEKSLSFAENAQEIMHDFKLQIKKELLIKSLPSIKNHLNSPQLIGEIGDFENLTEKSFSSLSDLRHLMKSPDYLREVNRDELESLSPKELISFEIKPHFIQVFSAFKRAIIDHSQTLINEIETAPSIAVFSIESASRHFEDNRQPEEAMDMCKQGIMRSLAKVKDTRLLHQSFVETELEKLSQAISKMDSSITEITNNESAYIIKLRIVRAKAVAQSKEVKDRMLTKLKNTLPTILSKLTLFYEFLEDRSQKIAKQFAFEKTNDFISTDISDFLSQTQSSISNLPYVYQRLFSFEPLESFDLYIERKIPMQSLNLAFTKWKEGKFTPVILIGEKGSGKTTFIRKFIKTTIASEKVFLLDFMDVRKSPSEYFNIILESAQINNHLAGEKKIIAIDGLERLYESKINGFEYLLKLFKIISDTQKDIFWIVSVHSISWNYIDKSIQASNYFAYHIRLNNLDFQELVELIESRHNLSGYKIKFEDQQKKKGLTITKSYTEKEQQDILKKYYFDTMNRTVQGNILQAYLYWMRSAQLVDNNTIFIESDSTLSFDFVRSIPSEKLIVLRSILLQNGIDALNLAKTYRVDLSQSELQLKQLTDDGILSFYGNAFYINPLIYKQLITHLNNINLLH